MHVGGTVHVAGCPAVSHGAVPRNRGRGDRHRRFVWSPCRSEGALAATAGTNDSPWRDKRANDPDPRRLTQIRWDRTTFTATALPTRVAGARRATPFRGPAFSLPEPLVPPVVPQRLFESFESGL